MKVDRKREIGEELSLMRKQIEFLESHHTLRLISEDQYQETGLMILKRVLELEVECDLNKPMFTSKGLMYNDQAEIFKDYNEEIIKE